MWYIISGEISPIKFDKKVIDKKVMLVMSLDKNQ